MDFTCVAMSPSSDAIVQFAAITGVSNDVAADWLKVMSGILVSQSTDSPSGSCSKMTLTKPQMPSSTTRMLFKRT